MSGSSSRAHTGEQRIEAKLALPALDAVIIGPERPFGLHRPAATADEKVLALANQVVKAAKKADKPVGVSIGPDERTIRIYQEMGVDFISCGDDISFLHQGAKRTFAMVGRT